MWKDKKKQNEYHKKLLKQLADRWLANGCCRYCGIPSKPFSACFKHRIQKAKQSKKWYKKTGRDLRKSRRQNGNTTVHTVIARNERNSRKEEC